MVRKAGDVVKNREDSAPMTRHTGSVKIHKVEADRRPIQLRIVIPDGIIGAYELDRGFRRSNA